MVTNRGRDRHLRPVAFELTLAAARLTAIGLIAIGVSGVLAYGMGRVLGRGFVSGDAPGVTYTAARCRDLVEYVPHARTCSQAATIHHFGEVVWYRLAAGAGGVLLFVAAGRVRHRRSGGMLVPETFVATVAAVAFGVSGMWLLGQGIDLAVLSTNSGGGGYLSGAIVALACAAWFTVPVIKSFDVCEARPT